jgi:hypothetical protein
MADCAVLWFCNFLRLYYRLANFSLPRGTEHWNLAWQVRARVICGGALFYRGRTFGEFKGLFGKDFLEYRVSSRESGNICFLSLLCVIVIVVVDQCRLLLRLVYTIDF